MSVPRVRADRSTGGPKEVTPDAAYARYVERAQPFLDDDVEPECIRFFHGLLVAIAISAFLWGALAGVTYAVYVVITTI